MPWRIGMPELIIVLIIVLLLFGGGRIAQVGTELGKGISNLRAGLQGEDDEGDGEEAPEE